MKDGTTPSSGARLATRVAAIRAGERGAIARAITAIENEHPDGAALVQALAGDVGRAHVLGITGPPGAGKSTLIAALLAECTRRGRRAAVVAVDPSSPLSGGAVLGDRIRMSAAAAHDDVFVRSVASRGHGGGLASATRRIVDLLDAAGYDPVIVETVGAGQSEVAIKDLADTSVVVCPPGLGDDVQAIKAGILEIADVLVVSKGDSPLAGGTVRDLKDMLGLRRKRDDWKVPVLLTTAPQGDGVPALVDAVDAHAQACGRGRRHAPAAAPVAAPSSGHDVVQGLAARDAFLRHCGFTLVDAGPGRADVAMTVRAEHLNFNGTCHGGAVFALADSAFGLASNSHGSVAAGIEAHVSFHLAAHAGDRLVARASEVSRTPRLATYRIEVLRGADRIASFTGTVYVTRRHHARVPGPP
ncbi:MAG TPA: methylmalonyl Co-A mutase-associated GTPase MeaB [Casimicrobiaceae bacterium]|nr:methylmalonyl Co-A mutase-associated GTPase MeaB [Casimicrobiaceae bacterium]